jgi:L-ascorbate metabolism protein UlaG (beta-lactamase superfamily)
VEILNKVLTISGGISMKIRLIRHATLWLEYAGATFLIDPMFGDTAVNPPITNSGDERRNPLVPLPGTLDEWIAPDAVFITHLHRDHWDDAAAQVLPKSLIIANQGIRRRLVHPASITLRKSILPRCSMV